MNGMATGRIRPGLELYEILFDGALWYLYGEFSHSRVCTIPVTFPRFPGFPEIPLGDFPGKPGNFGNVPGILQHFSTFRAQILSCILFESSICGSEMCSLLNWWNTLQLDDTTRRYPSGKPPHLCGGIGQSCHSTPATNWKPFSCTKGRPSIGHQIEFCFYLRFDCCYIVMLEACWQSQVAKQARLTPARLRLAWNIYGNQ